MGPKPYELLIVLLEKPFEIVTREELGSRLWPGKTVLDCNTRLNMTASQLRKALSHAGDDRVYFKTISRKGYAFVVDLQDSDDFINSAGY
jgi:DNA-binding winged helix-turn-helix (wHTH) protein